MNDMSNLSNTVIAQSLAGRRLENKSVILTGAAGSIGRYISRHLLREGAKVTMTGRDRASWMPLSRSFLRKAMTPRTSPRL